MKIDLQAAARLKQARKDLGVETLDGQALAKEKVYIPRMFQGCTALGDDRGPSEKRSIKEYWEARGYEVVAYQAPGIRHGIT